MARAATRKKKSRLVPVLILLLIFSAITFILVRNHLVSSKNYDEVFDPSSDQSFLINIPSGASTKRISQILEESGIIESAWKFSLKARLNELDGKFQAGDYMLSASMSTTKIMEQLQCGKSATVKFTIPEGYTIRQTAAKLVEQGMLSDVQQFYDACADDYNYEFLDGIEAEPDPSGTLDARQNRLEGFLFPSTYEIYPGTDAHGIIDRMLKQYEIVYEKCREGLDDRAAALSAREIATLASLIEKESAVDKDRALISSVIYNRLKKGMLLQIDATVLYSLGEWKDRVLYKDLEIDSPYNTYKYEGLPVGPISSSGEASIYAALHPETSKYIYYVLKPDKSGAHNFAEDYKTFEKYKQEYLNSVNN